MDFLTLARTRCSIRGYTPRRVEAEKLNQILQAAHAAPTAANRQPVRLLVVQETAGLEKLSRAADLYGAPLAILVCADRALAWTRPFDGKQTTDIDAAILTDHMMLEAADLGLASVWIGYFKPDVIRAEFSLPDTLEPVSILAVGYSAGPWAAPDRHDAARIPLERLVSYETFSPD